MYLFSSPAPGLVTGVGPIGETLAQLVQKGINTCLSSCLAENSFRLLEGSRESHHTHTEDHRRVRASEATRQMAYRATAAGGRDGSDAEEHVGDRKRRVNHKTKAASESATPIGHHGGPS